MSNKHHGIRQNHKRGMIAAVLALAVLLCAAPAARTEAVDLKGPYSVEISKSPNTSDDILEASVVLDVYKVAEATAIDGEDAYTFSFLSPFETASVTGLLESIQAAYETDPASVSAEDVNALAQELAGIALNGGNEPGETVALDEEGVAAVQDKEAGLYLIIPRGSDLDDYTYVSETEGSTYVATVANGQEKQFVFAPILLPIPNRGYEDLSPEMQIDGNGDWTYAVGAGNTAASSGDWDSPDEPIEITLKAGEQDLNTKIRLDKELVASETIEGRGDTGTFAFTIEAVKNGKTVFSDARAITLGAPGKSSYVEIEDIPVGSEITVTEAYTGGDYKYVSVNASNISRDGEPVVDDDSRSITFTAERPESDDAVVLVSFQNTYNDTFKDGGSVTNHIARNDDGTAGGSKTYSDGATEELFPAAN